MTSGRSSSAAEMMSCDSSPATWPATIVRNSASLPWLCVAIMSLALDIGLGPNSGTNNLGNPIAQRFTLQLGQVHDAGQSQVNHLVQFAAIKRHALSSSLHFDEVTAAGGNHIHVGIGLGVFLIGQI